MPRVVKNMPWKTNFEQLLLLFAAERGARDSAPRCRLWHALAQPLSKNHLGGIP